MILACIDVSDPSSPLPEIYVSSLSPLPEIFVSPSSPLPLGVIYFILTYSYLQSLSNNVRHSGLHALRHVGISQRLTVETGRSHRVLSVLPNRQLGRNGSPGALARGLHAVFNLDLLRR